MKTFTVMSHRITLIINFAAAINTKNTHLKHTVSKPIKAIKWNHRKYSGQKKAEKEDERKKKIHGANRK